MIKAIDDPISRALRLSEEKASQDRPKQRRSRASFSGRPAKSESHLVQLTNQVKLDVEFLRSNRLLVSPELDDDVTADRYRLLNTRIRQRMAPRDWNKLGITSPAPREGKSLTSLNLAITASRENSEPVILVDADTRRPSICSYLGTEPPASLSDYLDGDAELADVMFTSPIYPGLHIIGNAQTSSRNILSKNRLGQLFQEIEDEGASVIIDLPPVLLGDDVLLVSPHTDAMLIVLRDEQSNLAELKETTDLLSDFNLLGTILNGSRETRQSTQGYYASEQQSGVDDV